MKRLEFSSADCFRLGTHCIRLNSTGQISSASHKPFCHCSEIYSCASPFVSLSAFSMERKFHTLRMSIIYNDCTLFVILN